MANNIVYIPPVKDCSYIDIEANMAVHINNAFTNKNVFRISDTLKEEELPLLTYDFKSKKWLTGRYIGKLFFNYNNKNVYKSLFHLIMVFRIRFFQIKLIF